MQRQFILLANGPLASGKSTLAEEFMKNGSRIFRVSFDTLKRLISDFDAEADRVRVKDWLFKLSQEAVNQGFSLYVEGSASLFEEMRAFFSELAKEKDIRFLEINLEAPLRTLLERLNERIQSGKAMVVKTEEQFILRYNKYEKHKNPEVPTYDTAELTPEHVYAAVVELLQK